MARTRRTGPTPEAGPRSACSDTEASVPRRDDGTADSWPERFRQQLAETARRKAAIAAIRAEMATRRAAGKRYLHRRKLGRNR